MIEYEKNWTLKSCDTVLKNIIWTSFKSSKYKYGFF